MTKTPTYYLRTRQVQTPQSYHPKQPKRKLSLQEAMAVKKDCRARFWSQVVIPVLLAESYFVKVWDICEDRNLIRFKCKTWLKDTHGCFDKFDAWINKTDGNMRFLLADYGVQMEKLLKRELTSLYVTFCAYFETKGAKDPRFKGEVQMAYTLIHLARDLFDCYFDLYSEHFGIDLREDYLPARIVEADNSFAMFADYTNRITADNLHPTQNYACIKAYEAFCDRLFNEKVLDKAGIKALELNHEDEFLSEIERKKMGIEKLGERYKIQRSEK